MVTQMHGKHDSSDETLLLSIHLKRMVNEESLVAALKRRGFRIDNVIGSHAWSAELMEISQLKRVDVQSRWEGFCETQRAVQRGRVGDERRPKNDLGKNL